MTTQFTYDELETAVCLWEEALEHRGQQDILGFRILDAGTAEARSEIIELAKPVSAAWGHIDGQFDEPFDWEFIPRILGYITDGLVRGEPLNVTDEQAIEFAKQIVGEQS